MPTLERTTQQSVDLIRVWAGITTNLRNKQGTYGPMTLQGLPLPRYTLTQMREIAAAWSGIADKVFVQLGGRPELMARVNKAKFKFIEEFSQVFDTYAALPSMVRTTAPFTDSGKYVWFPTAEKFYQAVSRYMIELNGTLWAIDNIESQYERWTAALPWGMRSLFTAGWYTAKDVTPQIKAAVDKAVVVAKASVGLVALVIRWAPYIAVGAAGIWVFRRIQGRG